MSASAYPWWLPLAERLGALAVVALGFTWRVERVGAVVYERALEGVEPCIFAFWHAWLLPLTHVHRGSRATVLVSRHRDGEIITRIIERLGYRTARGSSTRGGKEGLREMLEDARRGGVLAVTPDGPRGPAGRVKPGLAYLASRSGYPVVPVAAAARRAWRLRSWDGFRVPKPFTRVVVAYGEPLRVPSELDREGVEHWRRKLQEAIHQVTDQTAERLAETP